MFRASSNLPPGAAHDPRAPWNEREAAPCPDCEGAGYFRVPYRDEDGLEDYEDEMCGTCKGGGTVEDMQ